MPFIKWSNGSESYDVTSKDPLIKVYLEYLWKIQSIPRIQWPLKNPGGASEDDEEGDGFTKENLRFIVNILEKLIHDVMVTSLILRMHLTFLHFHRVSFIIEAFWWYLLPEMESLKHLLTVLGAIACFLFNFMILWMKIVWQVPDFSKNFQTAFKQKQFEWYFFV